MFSGAKKGSDGDLTQNEFLIPLDLSRHCPKNVAKRKQKRKRPDEFEMCKDGNIDELYGIYRQKTLTLDGREDLLSEKKLNGCSQCVKEEPIGVCGCARHFCSVCENKCFVCRRIQHISGLSKLDAEFVVTYTLREVLMQACTLARAKEPNEVLLGNLASRMVQAEFCLNLLNRM